jgi:hypothetical protein
MVKNRPIQIRLNEEERAAVEARAESEGTSISAVIRKAMEVHLKRPCARCGGSGREPRASRLLPDG